MHSRSNSRGCTRVLGRKTLKRTARTLTETEWKGWMQISGMLICFPPQCGDLTVITIFALDQKGFLNKRVPHREKLSYSGSDT